MTADRTCATCRWWNGTPAHFVNAYPPLGYGKCFRFPPTVLRLLGGEEEQHRPVMKSTDWCGEHAPKEQSDG
jgi:hypothetical protein